MPAVEAGPVHGVLLAHARVRDSARADAKDRRAAAAVSGCGSPYAARSLTARGPRHWAAAGGPPDALHGSGGPVSQAASQPSASGPHPSIRISSAI